MILIDVYPDGLEIKGHANSQKQSKYDLVCAGVSAIIKGALSWFEKKEVDVIIKKDIPLIKLQTKTQSERTKVKLDLLLKQLQTIQNEYSKYIKINNK